MTKTIAGGTQAVARSAALLREIAANGHEGASLAELAHRLELERPTAYRILQRLVLEGLAQQDPVSRSYTLGPLLYELGLAARPPQHFQGLAREALGVLAGESGDTAFAIAQSGMDTLCIDREEGSYPVKALLMSPGRRRPMGAGAGSLAMLSLMPQEKAHQILQANAVRLQASGEVALPELHAVIAQGRDDGFVLRTPLDAPEILSLAVAVCNAYGTPILALSISALRFRIENRMDFLLGVLQDTRRRAQGQMQGLASASPRA